MRTLLPLLITCLGAGCSGPERDVTVFAAASAGEVLGVVADAYAAETGEDVLINIGSSGALARQIEAGAAADLFLSAAEEWVDYLARRDLADAGTRSTVMRNRLVMVASAGSYAAGAASGGIADLLGSADRVAMGDPGHVPAGRYGRQALASAGAYDALLRGQHLVLAQNVRAALALVELGECDLGIVYATDARLSKAVTVVHEFPAGSHDTIEYVAVLTGRDPGPAAAFLAFLGGGQAAAVLEQYGFEPVRLTGP